MARKKHPFFGRKEAANIKAVETKIEAGKNAAQFKNFKKNRRPTLLTTPRPTSSTSLLHHIL